MGETGKGTYGWRDRMGEIETDRLKRQTGAGTDRWGVGWAERQTGAGTDRRRDGDRLVGRQAGVETDKGRQVKKRETGAGTGR